MWLAQDVRMIPYLAGCQAPLAVVGTMLLVCRFVSRELGHAFYGLIAMTVFGVTTTYHECVSSYSGSYFVISMMTFMLALVAAQSWRLTGRAIYLCWCVIFCGLSPAWLGGGILSGVWCAIYLFPWPEPGEHRGTGPWKKRWWLCAVPILGSLLFLAISLPRTAAQIIHAEHYHGKTVFQAFDLVEGTIRTARTLVDSQVLGMFGLHFISPFPWPVVLVGLVLLLCGGIWWWRRAANRRLMLLGISLVLFFDLLAFSARVLWPYDQLHNWTRYHLAPHLGLVFFLMGGLPGMMAKRFPFGQGPGLTHLQARFIGGLIVASLICHFPRCESNHFFRKDQARMFELIEEKNKICQTHGIDAATAREALGFHQMPDCFRGDNAWDFLRGSESPKPMTPAEAKRWLGPE